MIKHWDILMWSFKNVKKNLWEQVETLIFIPSSRAEFLNLGRIALGPDASWWREAACAVVGIEEFRAWKELISRLHN